MDPLDGYRSTRKLVKERFGQLHTIAPSFGMTLTDGPAIKTSDTALLLAFADKLKHCKNTLDAIGCLDEITSSDHLRVKCLDRAYTLLEAEEIPKLHHILQFVMAKA